MSFSNVFAKHVWVNDMRYSLVCLFFISLFFTSLNNLFIFLFLVECQGVFIIYFLVSSQRLVYAGSTSALNDFGRTVTQRQFYHLNFLFIQFWAAFISAALFAFAILRFSNIYGLIG